MSRKYFFLPVFRFGVRTYKYDLHKAVEVELDVIGFYLPPIGARPSPYLPSIGARPAPDQPALSIL